MVGFTFSSNTCLSTGTLGAFETPDSIPHVSINHLTGCQCSEDRCPEGWSAFNWSAFSDREYMVLVDPIGPTFLMISDYLSRQCVESSFMRPPRFRPFEVEGPRIRMFAASESDHFSPETEVRLLAPQLPTIRAVPRRLP